MDWSVGSPRTPSIVGVHGPGSVFSDHPPGGGGTAIQNRGVVHWKF